MITLTSDFGLKDAYVAEMKGVILTINPKATVVDITHEVEKFNVQMGAFMLASAAPYFPKGTVHLAVVDPGVGTQRRAIAIQTKQSYFVGPDNGILILAAKNQRIQHIYELTNADFMLSSVSGTFHGRDIFAPIAAHVDMGVKLQALGPEISNPVEPAFATIKRTEDSVTGMVLHVDRFGNIITNINPSQIPSESKIRIKVSEVWMELPLARTYAQAKPNEPIAVVGSHGFLEVALNQGSAAEKFAAKAGDKVEVALE